MFENQELIPNSLASIQIPSAEAISTKTFQTKALHVNVTSIELTAKSLSITLTSLVSFKQSQEQPKKYLK